MRYPDIITFTPSDLVSLKKKTLKNLHVPFPSEVSGGPTVIVAPPTSCTLQVKPHPMALQPISLPRSLTVSEEAPPLGHFLANHW